VNPQQRRKAILEYLARGVGASRECFDPDTGRFLAANGGWAVTNQDRIFPLALLYTTPGTPYHADADILALALRGGDALRDWQDEQGRFEFIKIDGSRWGKTYMCWPMYHWLEAYGLLRDEMDAPRRRRWEQGLRLCFAGTARMYEKSLRLHNIPCWHGMGLVRAGELLGEPSWTRIGTDLIQAHAAAQNGEGYWPEGGGPTTLYNLLYVHAIGLYYWFTADESVLPCLERALQFHLKFTYPDGSIVETVDGRVKYRPGCSTSGWPGFLPFAQGRRLVGYLLEQLTRDGAGGELDPRLAAVHRYLPDEPEEPIDLERRCYVAVHHGRALVRRSGPWFYCLSGYLTPTECIAPNARTRWRMDRQNYLGVWHERLGLVIGGGNSKHQPKFSTFEVIRGRVLHHQADRAELVSTEGRDTLSLAYGPVRCELSVAVEGEALELRFSVPEATDGPDRILAGFTIPLLDGKEVQASYAEGPEVLSARTEFGLGWPEDLPPQRRWVRIGPLRIDLPGGAHLEWPVYPFNPYAIDGSAPAEQAVATVSFPLQAGGEAKIVRLTVADSGD